MFSKNKKKLLMALCLTGLILLLLIFRGNSSHTSTNVTRSVPTGTYCTSSPEDWPTTDTVYLVLGKDNTYMVYRQFEVISRGTYENDTLSQTIAFYGDDSFTGSYGDDYSEINLSAKDNSYGLKKYSGTCLYINVPDSQ